MVQFDPVNQKIERSPERFHGLKIRVMQESSHQIGQGLVDRSNQFCLTMHFRDDMRAYDISKQCFQLGRFVGLSFRLDQIRKTLNAAPWDGVAAGFASHWSNGYQFRRSRQGEDCGGRFCKGRWVL